MITLVAQEGKIYTDGQVYCKSITVTEEKAEEFYEIPEEEILLETLL